MDIKEKVKGLPSCPGVYLMKDSLNSVIYVGKSKNLKSRVGSYFINSKSHSPKVVKLVKNLKDFDYIITDTEFEAFMLECKLIQQIKPIYNRLMKTPTSYTYVKVTIHDDYPEIEMVSEDDKEDGNLYFGPYTNKNTVERGLQGIKENCKILCSGNSRKSSACLNYSLGLCIGMCSDSEAKELYLTIINKIVDLLNRRDTSILEDMQDKMKNAAENFDFEAAARYRDYLGAVNYLISKVEVVEYTKKNRNIILLEPLPEDGFKLFLIKGSKILFREKYCLKDFSYKSLIRILKDNILLYFNNTGQRNSIDIGKEEIDESQIIHTYLKTKSNNCRYVIIANKWLKDSNSTSIDQALTKLLLKPTNTK